MSLCPGAVTSTLIGVLEERVGEGQVPAQGEAVYRYVGRLHLDTTAQRMAAVAVRIEFADRHERLNVVPVDPENVGVQRQPAIEPFGLHAGLIAPNAV